MSKSIGNNTKHSGERIFIADSKDYKRILIADFNFKESKRKIDEFSEKYPVIGDCILKLKEALLLEENVYFDSPDVRADYFIGEILDVNSEFIFPSKKNREFRNKRGKIEGMVVGYEGDSPEEFTKTASESSRIDKISLDLQPDLSSFCTTEYTKELLKNLLEQVKIELEGFEQKQATIEEELNASLNKEIDEALEKEFLNMHQRIKEKMKENGKKEIAAKLKENPEDIELAMILAKAYKKGFGVTVDDKKASVIYKKYADKYYPSAQYELANLYAKGVGDEPEIILKRRTKIYYEKAAEAGNFLAQYKIYEIYHIEAEKSLNERSAEVQEFVEEVRFWNKEGLTDPRLKMGDCFAMGTETKVDTVKAAFFYLKAAQRYGDLSVITEFSQVFDFIEKNSKLNAEEIIEMMEAFETTDAENVINIAKDLEFSEQNLQLNSEVEKKLGIVEMVINNFVIIIEESKRELSLEDLAKIYKKFTSIEFLDFSIDDSEIDASEVGVFKADTSRVQILYNTSLVCRKIASSMMEKISPDLYAAIFEDRAASEGVKPVLISNFKNDSFTIENLPISQEAVTNLFANSAVRFSSEFDRDRKLVILKVKIDEPLEVDLPPTAVFDIFVGPKGVRKLVAESEHANSTSNTLG